MLGGLGDLETVYNFRLIWRILDAVAKSSKGHRFIPGEVRLNAIKNELARRELSLSSYYNADGLIINDEYNAELVLLLVTTKKNFDHIKAAYGLLAVLHNIAYRYNYADIELFKKLKMSFVHVIGDKIRLWTLKLATSKLYILNRQRSCQVPITHENSKDKLMNVVNMIWELQEVVTESSAVLKSIEKSHKENEKIANATKLESYLREAVDVKLPGSYINDIDDIDLSSSPLRPASVCSDS
ncbi:unnamed protein product [Rhizopus stolonifer]